LFAILALPAIGHAQRYTGSLEGEVSDSSGAKIVGATVTAIDTTTNFSTKAVTNGQGSYAIPFLTADTYTVTVEATGFQKQIQTGIILTADSNAQADFKLSTGSHTETVTVNSSSEQLLDRETADIGTTLTAQQVTDLPSIGRVPFLFASLTAGMYDSSFMQGKTGTALAPGGNSGTSITASGVGGGHTMLYLNGSVDAPRERISGAAGGYGGFVPSPEAVQEVKTQVAMYDAEYGNTGGASINTVLRSGTNTYHGSAYYVFRNTYLDANTYERVATQNSPIAKSRTPRINGGWNQPGFVFDGPVRIPHLYDGRNKTFFLFAYEHIQLHQPNAGSADVNVPTDAEKNGDFSALCTGGFDANGVCLQGGGFQIYDPLTAAANGNRTPFPYNKIPSNRFNPVGIAMINMYPEPNATPTSTANYNYISPNPVAYQGQYSFVAQLYQQINENNRFNAVFYRQIINQQYSNQSFPTPIGPQTTDEAVLRNTLGGSVDYTTVLPRNWVLDARAGVIYHPFALIYAGDPFNLSSIGMSTTGIAFQTFPGTTMTDNFIGFQAGAGGQISADTYGSADVIASKIHKTHDFRFGFEGLLERYNADNPLSGLGPFAFNRQFTQENSSGTAGSACPAPSCAVGGDASSGSPLPAVLLGYPSSGSYASNVSLALQVPWYGFFFQDNWRASRNLTLNMGFRWENQAPYTERHNRLNNGFCTTCVNPIQSQVPSLPLLGGLEFVSSSNRHAYASELTDFQPRFGVSYALGPDVVLHAGSGLTYINSMETPYAQGWTTSTSYIATTDNIHPYTSFANPFPNGTVQPSGSSSGLSTAIGQSIGFMAPGYVRPRLWQWSASAQTAFPWDTSLQIAYVGNRVYDWEVSRNINSLSAQYLTGTAANATLLAAKVANPMYGVVPITSALGAATLPRSDLDVPYPEFGSVTESYIPSGGSQYNALQVTVRKTMSHGLSILGSFTWSHEMDSFQYLNWYDPKPERYMDSAPNLLANIAVIYQFPRFSSAPRYVREVIGGWQGNTVFRDYNGNLVATPGGYTLLSDPHIGNPTATREFNTCWINSAGVMQITGVTTATPACRSASDIPAFQQQNGDSPNAIPPYFNHIRARAGNRVDVSLFKIFPIRETATFEIRGEFFNVMNTPLWANPGVGPGSTTFGELTLTQQNDPRIGQLTARINF
jgi:hypothetical protein